MKKSKLQSERQDTEGATSALTQEIEDLLQQVILEEASRAIWKQFESALLKLDKDSLNLLEGHLDGVHSKKLAENKNISENEVHELISQMKRDLIRQLRKSCNVRH